MALFDDSLFDGSPPPAPPPPAPGAGYLGRFQVGQSATLSVQPVDSGGYPAAPDAAPLATVSPPAGPSFSVKLAMSSGTTFALPIFLGFGFSLGTYHVSYSFVVAGVSGSSSGSFDVIPGGDPGGRVLSMCAYVRPEATYVVAQVSCGALVQGRNPRLRG